MDPVNLLSRYATHNNAPTVYFIESIICGSVIEYGDQATPTQLVISEIPCDCYTVQREGVRFIVSNTAVWTKELTAAITKLKSDLEVAKTELHEILNIDDENDLVLRTKKIVKLREEIDTLQCIVFENGTDCTDRADYTDYTQNWSKAGAVNGFIINGKFVGILGTGETTIAFLAGGNTHFTADIQIIDDILSITEDDVLSIIDEFPCEILKDALKRTFFNGFPTSNLKICNDTCVNMITPATNMLDTNDVIMIAKNDVSFVVPRSTLHLYCNVEIPMGDIYQLDTDLTDRVAEFLGSVLNARKGNPPPDLSAEEVIQFTDVMCQLGFEFE